MDLLPQVPKKNLVPSEIAADRPVRRNTRPWRECLLGRVLVVDHIDNAIAIARKYRHSIRIVTPEGDLLTRRIRRRRCL